mgnify:CR=1 FL=1
MKKKPTKQQISEVMTGWARIGHKNLKKKLTKEQLFEFYGKKRRGKKLDKTRKGR